jgi:hypothetical protein
MKILLWTTIIASLSLSLFCSLGVLQAASLFTGERALNNLKIWGGLSMLFFGIFVVGSVVLYRMKPRATKLEID